jgi:hypothetical protein
LRQCEVHSNEGIGERADVKAIINNDSAKLSIIMER